MYGYGFCKKKIKKIQQERVLLDYITIITYFQFQYSFKNVTDALKKIH